MSNREYTVFGYKSEEQAWTPSYRSTIVAGSEEEAKRFFVDKMKSQFVPTENLEIVVENQSELSQTDKKGSARSKVFLIILFFNILIFHKTFYEALVILWKTLYPLHTIFLSG